MFFLRCLCCTLTALAILSNLGHADDWPEFRGPTGQGLVRGALPTQWSGTDNVVWKQALPGVGWSSPVIREGRIFLTTAVPLSKKRRNDQSLRCLAIDEKSGKILWDHEIFRQDGSQVEALHQKASHANPTPIVDVNRVYVHFGSQGTAALDREGEVLWRNAQLKYRQWHGTGGSPILFENLLIFNCDGEDIQFVVALNRDTGAVEWKVDRKIDVPSKFSYCTPLLIDVQGKPQLITPGAGAVMSYEPGTGKEIWRVQLEDGYSNVPRPVYGHGLVFLSNSTEQPNLLAIRPDGKGDVTASHIAWRVRRSVPLTSSPLLVGDEIYMVSDNGFATCLEAKTGKTLWRERLGGQYSASPLHADGKVYFQNEAGLGTIVPTGGQFKVIAQNNLNERVLASYAAANGSLFIRGDKHLYRIGK